MNLALHLPSGELLRTQALAGEILTVLSPRAFPPGAPLTLELAADDERFPITAKTVGSKRTEGGSYELRVRLVSVRRDHRILIERLL